MLVPDWRTVLRRAWSVRAMALLFLVAMLEVLAPLADGLIPRWAFAVVTALLAVAGIAARVLAQRSMGD